MPRYNVFSDKMCSLTDKMCSLVMCIGCAFFAWITGRITHILTKVHVISCTREHILSEHLSENAWITGRITHILTKVQVIIWRRRRTLLYIESVSVSIITGRITHILTKVHDIIWRRRRTLLYRESVMYQRIWFSLDS